MKAISLLVGVLAFGTWLAPHVRAEDKKANPTGTWTKKDAAMKIEVLPDADSVAKRAAAIINNLYSHII